MPKAYIIVVLLVPVFGLASLIGTALALRRPPSGLFKPTGEDVRQYSAIGKSDDDGASIVIPLEEALLMSDAKTRRSLMMDILHSEPSRYIAQLKMACLNSDMEVTHYATTTIMEIQRDFDLSIQRMDGEWEELRANAGMLDEAIRQIDRYLSSGLLDGFSLHRVRQRYNDLLSLKIRQQPKDKQTLLALVVNKISMQDLAGAEKEMNDILQQWPNAEDAWLLALRLAVERRDRRLLDLRLKQMGQASIHWSAEGKSVMQFWRENAHAAEPDNV